MKKIYLVLTRTGTRFSSMIQKATGYEYTHASIALDKELSQLYSFGRKSMILPFIAGFVREDVNGGVFKKYSGTKCIIYELDVSDKIYNNIRSLINKFESNKDDYRYNFLGLPFIFFNIPYKRDKHFLCSQFVAYILQESGAVRLHKEFTIMKPKDLLNVPKSPPIYNGILNEYVEYGQIY